MQVSRRESESQESLLRRSQRVVQLSGILREVKPGATLYPVARPRA
ncbi:MAG: 30S ribosomal protein S21 [Chloroflexi bacterium]|nr:30S ribosomal protein S21 [Chloroflexota bacterium]